MPRHGARFAASICLGIALTVPLAGANLTGTWIGTLEKRERTPARDIAFRFVHDGARLTGKAYDANGPSNSSPILEGRVADGGIRFDVEAREQAGNQINIVLYRFKGVVSGPAIELTRERASARNAVSGSDIPVRRPSDSDEEDRKRRFRSVRLELLLR